MVVIHMTSGPTELVARRFLPSAGLGLGIEKSPLLAARRRDRAGKGANGRNLPDFIVSGGGDGVGAASQGGAATADATADAPAVGWVEGIARLAEAAAAEGQEEEGVDNVPSEEGKEQAEEDVAAAGEQDANEEGGDEKAEEEEGVESGEEEEEGKSGASYNPYGFLAGDPILNQNVQSGTYVDPCQKTLNCPTAEDEEKNAKWRSTKQVRLGASELMERQLVQVLLKMQRRAEECEKGFPDDEAKIAKCTEDHLQRACDKYAEVKRTCDWSEAQVMETHQALTLKVCEGDSKKAMDELCPMFTKLPGVSVTHWPWQDFNMNMGARSFSADALLAGGMHESADY